MTTKSGKTFAIRFAAPIVAAAKEYGRLYGLKEGPAIRMLAIEALRDRDLLPSEAAPAKKKKRLMQADVPREGPWPSVDAFVKLYNEATPDECPACVTLSPTRQAKIRQALMQFPDEKWWKQVFDYIHHSPVLRGKVKSKEHQHFRCDLDWILAKGKEGTENAVKVHDGRYLERK